MNKVQICNELASLDLDVVSTVDDGYFIVKDFNDPEIGSIKINPIGIYDNSNENLISKIEALEKLLIEKQILTNEELEKYYCECEQEKLDNVKVIKVVKELEGNNANESSHSWYTNGTINMSNMFKNCSVINSKFKI